MFSYRMKSSFSVQIQRYINTKQNNRSTTTARASNFSQKISIEYYKIPLKDVEIVFIDSMDKYNRLLDRLFKTNNEDEELRLGFDCK